jgi:hypothetical protein
MERDTSNERTLELGAILADCMRACRQCASACLEEEDARHLAECIRLDWDCADACSLALAFLNRQSDSLELACDFCSAMCEACAEECARHSHMDHCRICADACRRCAEACADVAAYTGRAG